MPVKEVFANEATESSIDKGEEPEPKSSSSIKNFECRYHMHRPCDCDRYFARPGTAQYGC